jgi:hypothetical protein
VSTKTMLLLLLLLLLTQFDQDSCAGFIGIARVPRPKGRVAAASSRRRVQGQHRTGAA